MQKKEREKKVDTKEETKEIVVEDTKKLNTALEKAVLTLVKKIKENDLTFNKHLKQPAILTGLVDKHFKTVLVNELEKENL